MRFLLLKLFAVFVYILICGVAFADPTPSTGGACSDYGHMAISPSNGVLYVLMCNGSGRWENASIQVGSAGGGCSSANEGTLSYDDLNNSWTFCNGNSYVPFNSAAGIAKIKASTSTAAIYPSSASCNAPACDSGYVSKGCQSGAATSLLNDLNLSAASYKDMVTNSASGFSASSCTRSASASVLGLFAMVTCARLCISTS